MRSLDLSHYNNEYKDITLNIVCIPAGAGSSFMGYLQAFYIGIVPYKNIGEMPKKGEGNSPRHGVNQWDTTLGAGVPSFREHSEHGLLNSRILEEYSRGSLNEQKNYDLCLNSANNFFNNINGRIEKNNSIHMFAHIFPIEYAFENVFKQIQQLFRVEIDEETAHYCCRLKGAKTPNWMEGDPENLLIKSKVVYEHQELAKKFPILNSINYKRFFLDIDEDEIKKYFTFIENKEFDNDHLEPICEMIKSYTKLNKELLG